MFLYWTPTGHVIAGIITFLLAHYMHYQHKDASKSPVKFTLTWVGLYLFFGVAA